MEVSAMKSNVGMSWNTVSLEKICTMLSGNAWSASKFKEEGKTPIIRIQNLGNNENEKFIWWDEPYDEKFIVKKGDILLSLSGSIKVDIWKDRDALLNQRIVKLVPNKDVDNKWFFWQITNIILDIERMGKWALVNNVSITDLKDLEIPLPPLSTQKRIAEILDAADALRRKDQELIKKYDELAQAIFIDMFGDPVKNEKGWEVKKLGTVSNMKAGNFISASEIYTDIDDGLYPCYGGNGLRGFVKSHTHNGDYILIGRQGALCGNVKITTGKFHATEHAVVCSPKIEYNVLWLYFLLGNLNLNKYSSGAAQPGLNVSTLVNIDLIFAPIKFQNQFAEKLKSIEIQFEKIKGNLLNSNKLFNSLIQKAFKGELV